MRYTLGLNKQCAHPLLVPSADHLNDFVAASNICEVIIGNILNSGDDINGVLMFSSIKIKFLLLA